jgi:hypothetical protein
MTPQAEDMKRGRATMATDSNKATTQRYPRTDSWGNPYEWHRN